MIPIGSRRLTHAIPGAASVAVTLLVGPACNALLGNEWPTLLRDSGTPVEAGDADPANCGSIGHHCLGGQCLGGRCQPVAIALNQGWAVGMTFAGGDICWAADYPYSKIRCFSREGTCDGVCRQLTDQAFLPSGPTFAPRDGWLYWADSREDNTGDVMRIWPEGGAPEVVANAQPWPGPPYATDQYVYWPNALGPVWIHRVPLNGADAGPEAVALGGMNKYPVNVLVDDTFVYWSDFQTDTLYRVLLTQIPCRDDSCAWIHVGTVSAVPSSSDASYVYVDVIGQYGPAPDGSIVRIPKTCNSPSCIETVADQLVDPWSARDDTHVYWTDYEDGTADGLYGHGTIRRVGIGQTCHGTGCELIVSGDAVLGGLLTDSRALYFSSRLDVGSQKGEAKIMRLAK